MMKLAVVNGQIVDNHTIVAVCQMLTSLFTIAHPELTETFDLFNTLIVKPLTKRQPTLTLKTLRLLSETHGPLHAFYRSNPHHEPEPLALFLTRTLQRLAVMRPGEVLDEQVR